MKASLHYGAALLMAGALLGCSSSEEGTSASFNVSIYPSKDLAKTFGHYPTFEADVLGARQEEVIRLSKYSPEKYFESGSSLRQYFDPVTYRFSDDNLRKVTFRSGTPEYKKLMGRSPEYLVVMVNLPLMGDPDSGADKKDDDKKSDDKLDPRKFIYKIPTGFFDDNPDLYLKIAGAGIVRTTEADAEDDLPEAPETAREPRSFEFRCVPGKSGKTPKPGDPFGNMECREIVPGSEPPDRP
ncbi:hypothetical protein [Succinimonas sp.]|uniref:hypothetical protein n=1 Tax=Succinimonas sp. TaxID=1936151 RepID=UPI00386CE614